MPEAEWQALREAELTQLCEEGRDPEAVQALFAESADAQVEGERLWTESIALPYREDWRYEEPSTWERIVAVRPEKPPTLPVNESQLPDRILGAWLGRCAGCMLGKPVEGAGRAVVRALAETAGAYPLRDYLPPLTPPEGLNFAPPDSPLLRGNIRRAERDDDTDYPVVNLLIWERQGPEFTPEHVAEGWLGYLPYHQVYTAERAAYRNLVCGMKPPDSALLFNPYREWIGAQIRADLWGYLTPGQPERAAEFAWRDACISHTRNGIYGEMFFAALIAACLATRDLGEALEAALCVIPARSRFAEMVADCLAWYALDGDWERTCDRVEEKYGHYHPVHTLNNAALVLIALLHAKQDFSAAVGLAVQGGWDTDCNGATAGSVWGALHGAEAIPRHWTEPLNDTLVSAVFGRSENSIRALAEETLAARLS